MWFGILFLSVFVLVYVATRFREHETKDIPKDSNGNVDVPPFGAHAFIVVLVFIIFVALTIYTWATI